MQVITERGMISVDATYQTKERATMDGYSYSFTAHNVYMPDVDKTLAKVDFYSISHDNRGLLHSFAAVY